MKKNQTLKQKEMVKLNYTLLMIFILVLSSCASLTPVEVNNTLPTYTKSMFFTPKQAAEKEKNNKCKFLVKGRSYAAPIGLTSKNDLKNAAKGIDEWVELDGGNAYVLINYKWVTVGDDGSTQLYIDFDTMQCK